MAITSSSEYIEQAFPIAPTLILSIALQLPPATMAMLLLGTIPLIIFSRWSYINNRIIACTIKIHLFNTLC